MAVSRWFLLGWESDPFTHERVARVMDDHNYVRLIPKSKLSEVQLLTGAGSRKVSSDYSANRQPRTATVGSA